MWKLIDTWDSVYYYNPSEEHIDLVSSCFCNAKCIEITETSFALSSSVTKKYIARVDNNGMCDFVADEVTIVKIYNEIDNVIGKLHYIRHRSDYDCYDDEWNYDDGIPFTDDVIPNQIHAEHIDYNNTIENQILDERQIHEENIERTITLKRYVDIESHFFRDLMQLKHINK